MNKSLTFRLFLIIIFAIVLSGCWNYKEIERLAIVSGLAVDKNIENNTYVLTTEIVDLQGSLTEGNVKARRIQSEGYTILDAIRNMINISAQKLYWSHAKAIIISQDIAQEGIAPILEFLTKDNEPRMTLDIFISKEKTARELLEQQSVTTDIRSYEMEYMIIGNRDLSKSAEIDLNDLMDILSSEGISPYLPAIGVTLNDGKRTADLSGTAVFKQDKLIGFLNEVDTKSFLFVRDQIDGGLLITFPEENSTSKVTLEIFKNKTNIKPVYSGEKLLMQINIHTEVAIAENDLTINYISEKGRSQIKEIAESQLEQSIQNIIKKVQRDFGSDIFGFGRIIKAYSPDLWENIKDNWDELFKSLKVDVDVKINIRGSGLTSKPVKVGE